MKNEKAKRRRWHLCVYGYLVDRRLAYPCDRLPQNSILGILDCWRVGLSGCFYSRNWLLAWGLVMNNCKECKFRVDQTGLGHCYMFKNEPRFCGQFRFAASSGHRRRSDEPRTHSDGGGTTSSHSWLNTQDSIYNTSSTESTSSSDSFSSGGGDSGGGGSSGDW